MKKKDPKISRKFASPCWKALLVGVLVTRVFHAFLLLQGASDCPERNHEIELRMAVTASDRPSSHR